MKKCYNWIIFILAINGLFFSVADADVKLPAVFGDHMVLQQKSSVVVWGWAEPGERVIVKGSWQENAASDHADADGKWSVAIQTPKADKPVTLTVKGNNEIILNDILLGEVWICSGQSNMEWSMARLGTDRSKQDIENADGPQIRLFTIERAYSSVPQTDCKGQWQVCSPKTASRFSATGYYFGRSLHENIKVPIGLISTSWGGTKAEAWTSRETLAGFEQFSDQLATLVDPDKAAAAMKAKHQQQLKKWETIIAENDAGIQEQWYMPDYDDSGWQTMNLPAVWSGTELAAVDGIVWYRRTTNLPSSWLRDDLELHLGSIDDIATVWINGTALGTTAGWNQKRVYQIPQSVFRTGLNTMAVRVIDTGTEGGFRGQKDDMRIGPKGAGITACATMAGTWRYQISHKGTVAAVPVSRQRIDQNTPTVLYNAMIAPLRPFRTAGVIWYQGESNSRAPILYRTLFPAMITDWRQQWGQGDFPFYFVQIAPFQYKSGLYGQVIRESQLMTLDAVKNIGMVVTMDIGKEKDIHPRNKHDVGDRLARWALAGTYGKKNIVYSGPLYKEMAVENKTIRISFDYADGGLIAGDVGLTDVMIAGVDKKFVPAKAIIDGQTLVVSGDGVTRPVAVRYGWSNWVIGSLFNAEGLPASSFRTDDWPLE